LSGTIDHYELMLEQQQFCGDGAGAARAKEFRESNEQVNRQWEQIAHTSRVSRAPIFTRPHRKGYSRYTFTNSPPIAPG
jgi:hypothetical protein